MSHDKLVGLELIVIDQQPSAKLLLDIMEPVAHGGLRDLGHQRLSIEQQQSLKHSAPGKFGSHGIRSHPDGAPAALDYRPVCRRLAAHKKGDSDEAVVPGDSYLGGPAIFHNIQQRNYRRCRKIYVRHPVARLVEDFAERHQDCFQMRFDTVIFIGRQRGQEMILKRVIGSGHMGSSDARKTQRHQT
jgi:hypothetical protein